MTKPKASNQTSQPVVSIKMKIRCGRALYRRYNLNNTAHKSS